MPHSSDGTMLTMLKSYHMTSVTLFWYVKARSKVLCFHRKPENNQHWLPDCICSVFCFSSYFCQIAHSYVSNLCNV